MKKPDATPPPASGNGTYHVVLVEPPRSSDLVVDDWFRTTFHNKPIPTALYNEVYASLEGLKKRLAALPR